LVINDLDRSLTARLDGLGIDAGALAVEAIDASTISALARGQVYANGTSPFQDWTELAENGSVATNWLLGGTRVAANDVNLKISGDASLRADANASLTASNEVITNTFAGEGSAFVYNLIGRQGAGTLKSNGVQQFLAGNAGTVATYEVGASFDKGFIDVGGNFSIDGNLALKASASLSQATDSSLVGASGALAQNLSEASTFGSPPPRVPSIMWAAMRAWRPTMCPS
jgi:hypothetical protein